MAFLRSLIALVRRPGPTAIVQTTLARADDAQHAGNWQEAADLLAIVVAQRPQSAAARVQYAHALKEAGNIESAERSYRIAADLAPRSTDALLHLADMLRHDGRLAEAGIGYADILRRDPEHRHATRMLAEMNGRANLPDDATMRPRHGALLARIDQAGTAMTTAIETWIGGGLYPPDAYDRFRQSCPVVAPPRDGSVARPIGVQVQAGAASPAMVRATLASLGDQTLDCWIARVVGFDHHAGHAVTTMADRDPRVRFVGGAAVEGSADLDFAGELILMAGVVLDPNALAWFAFAARRSGADFLYGDHDRTERDWRTGDVRRAPALFGYHDGDVIAATSDPPVALFVAGSDGRDTIAPLGKDSLRRMLTDADSRRRRVVHVPRLLASILQVPGVARDAPCGAQEARTGAGEVAWGVPEALDDVRPLTRHRRRDGMLVASVAASPVGPGRIAVLIPTRDAPAMLERCVASLRARATHPDRLDLIVLDNRSETTEARSAMTRIAATDRARVVAHDAAFNWSAMNNRILALSDAETCVFANDDVAMLSDGWDVQAEGFCARPDVGAVGARLLYPDGTYQHAGIAFGLSATQLCVHEGLGHDGNAGGPLDRWLQTRRVAAVTGAFLATSRAVMQAVGGFDEDLALAYNDIDYCFRVRASGRVVLYTPALTLTHHESQTRGRNVTRDQIAWDEAELQTLAARWGAELRWDPCYDLHFALRGQPFDGYREPPLSEILNRIDRGAAADPWGVSPRRPDAVQDASACRL